VRQVEVAAAIGAAAAKRLQQGAPPEEISSEARAAAGVVANLVTQRAADSARGRVILWVDDRPANNHFERQALQALGFSFVLANSTEEALEKVAAQQFDVIISDMGRPPDQRAGYTLLGKLRDMGIRTPYIIYAGSRAPEHQAESRRRGAVGTTNRPDDLVRLVLNAVRSS
jgi:CheY-like chemotaxis protein